MITIDQVSPIVSLAVKGFFLFAFAIYIVFAGVVVRQVYLMTSTLAVGFETQIRLIGWLHLALAVGVFLFALGGL